MSVIQVIVLLIRVPSFNFVDLSVPKIWPIFGHSVKRPGDLSSSK